MARAIREWAQKLEAKPKYVVSSSRSDFPWQNTIKVEGDLREAITALKAKTERGVQLITSNTNEWAKREKKGAHEFGTRRPPSWWIVGIGRSSS